MDEKEKRFVIRLPRKPYDPERFELWRSFGSDKMLVNIVEFEFEAKKFMEGFDVSEPLDNKQLLCDHCL